MTERESRFCTICHQIFNTPLGKELMEFLEEIMQAPVADPNRDANFAFYREGENNMIRRVKAAMRLHETGQEKKLRGENDGHNAS